MQYSIRRTKSKKKKPPSLKIEGQGSWIGEAYFLYRWRAKVRACPRPWRLLTIPECAFGHFRWFLFAKQKVTACHTGKKQKHPEDGSGREQKHYKHSHRHIDQCKSADTFHLSFSCTVLLHYTMHSFRKHAKIPFQNIFCPEWDLCSLFCFCLI